MEVEFTYIVYNYNIKYTLLTSISDSIFSGIDLESLPNFNKTTKISNIIFILNEKIVSAQNQ